MGLWWSRESCWALCFELRQPRQDRFTVLREPFVPNPHKACRSLAIGDQDLGARDDSSFTKFLYSIDKGGREEKSQLVAESQKGSLAKSTCPDPVCTRLSHNTRPLVARFYTRLLLARSARARSSAARMHSHRLACIDALAARWRPPLDQSPLQHRAQRAIRRDSVSLCRKVALVVATE